MPARLRMNTVEELVWSSVYAHWITKHTRPGVVGCSRAGISLAIDKANEAIVDMRDALGDGPEGADPSLSLNLHLMNRGRG